MFYAINNDTGLITSKMSQEMRVKWCIIIEYNPTEEEKEKLRLWCTIEDWEVVETDKYNTKMANMYITKRREVYPSFWEQLDMMYKDKVNWTSDWEDLIKDIKEKYPKN